MAPSSDNSSGRKSGAATADGGGSGAGPDPRRWKALAVCLVAGFMTLLDVSIVNVALPSIREGLRAGVAELQWVLSGYALAFGLLLIPAGRIGDARGRRAVFMTGLTFFTLASAACGAAQSSEWLVVARVAQGLAGGLIAPQISALIQQMFSGPERGRAFGMFGTVVGISTAVGPVLGGLIIHAAGPDEGWRWVFYVNLPLGAVCLLLARRLLPDTPTAGTLTVRRLDPVGVLLLGLGVLALLLPFVQAQQWHGNTKWLLVPLAAVLLAAFAAWEHRWSGRGGDPVLHLSLFRVRSFSAGSVLILLYFAGFTSIFFITTLFLQSGLHYSALEAGLSITPFALGSGAAAAVGGRLVGRFGRALVSLGLTVVALGLGGTALAVHLVPDRGAGWAMAAPLLVAGLGSGLVISPNQTLTLSQVPVASAGSAGGTLQTGQRVGSAIGIAAVGSSFFGQVRRGGWAAAYDRGLLMAVAFVVAALLIALADTLGHRREQARATGEHGQNSTLRGPR
ncbi:MFS transporter [Streptomyces sulfonofaciens]|uniref:MFS transporter n=1 Tax=Streptomyces sulfonofaciens TaxID=68272 RepID=A0A919GBV3_9ACTN|nr:MFS transporter [Streptomyces sulfonofaciens]GHH81922.1 MFS transporter [Streptomyces sulfonofaciens]